jgi:hypothetical protein
VWQALTTETKTAPMHAASERRRPGACVAAQCYCCVITRCVCMAAPARVNAVLCTCPIVRSVYKPTQQVTVRLNGVGVRLDEYSFVVRPCQTR